MKLPGFLSKPRWLSKDATIRRAGVADDNEDELIANLGRLAREDADAGVRLTAMRRLADPGIVQGIARDDGDAGVRKQARVLWFELLTGTHAKAPALADRIRLLRAQDDNELIEHLARNAREPELRRAALDRVARPAVLFERALADADPALRIAAAERIDDEAQLLRLAERARKTDKHVSRIARERVDALRLHRGDDAALELRARKLCEQLEHLLREPQTAAVEADIATRWSEIEARVGASLQQRYRIAQEHLLASRAPPRANTPLPEDESVAIERVDADGLSGPVVAVDSDTTDSTPPPEPIGEELAAPLLAQARFAASLDNANAQRELEREQQRALLEEIEAALTPFEAAVEAGAAAQAHAARTRLDGLRRRNNVSMPRALAARLAAAEAGYAKLSQWQHWADDQRRVQLCEEIEALAGSGLHPDAIASRVRDAQVEWTRLEAAEGRDAGRSGGLGRRFHAGCRNALAPAQAYFKKRQELRQSHAQQVASLLERVGALGEDDVDWPGLIALRRDVAESLRGLDRVEPRERKALAERLKTSLGALDARVTRRDEEIANAKAVLIAQAEALTLSSPPRGAVAAARDLQQRWQRVGNGRRARDQAQWKSFRAAIDAVFGALDAERSERSARDQDARTQAETLCSELETLAGSEDKVERGAVARIESAWDGLRVRDDALSKRFQSAQAQLRDAETRRQRLLRQVRFEAWLARYTICRSSETLGAPVEHLRERWDAAPSTDIAAEALARRFESAINSSPVAEADTNDLRDVLIELDFLAGAEPPEDERERRRQLQLERLSNRMRGHAAVAPYDELANLLVRWTELGRVPSDDYDSRLARAVERTLAALA